METNNKITCPHCGDKSQKFSMCTEELHSLPEKCTNCKKFFVVNVQHVRTYEAVTLEDQITYYQQNIDHCEATQKNYIKERDELMYILQNGEPPKDSFDILFGSKNN